MRNGKVGPSGEVTMEVVRALPPLEKKRTMLRHSLPHPGLPWEVFKYRFRNLPNVWRGLWKALWAHIFHIPSHFGTLRLVKFKGDGGVVDYGIVSFRVVTTAGVNFIVDAFQNLVEPENMKFHGFGTSSTAEAVGDTALVTELTTQYPTDNTRPTGSQTEGAANVYRTVATLDPDADVTITEHGIFTQAATGGGTLLDRSVFTGIALVGATGDTLQATYDFTVTAGS